MTYINQRDTFRCGPVTIFNALRWAGKAVTYEKDIKRLNRLCECKPKRGTSYRPFLRTLKKEGRGLFQVELIIQPTLHDIDNNLEAGNILAWNMKHQRGRHYALIIGQPAPKFYDVANWCQGCDPVVPIPRKELEQYVKSNDRNHRIWVISKVNNDQV